MNPVHAPVSAPPEFPQSLFSDAEVMGDLVDHGAGHFPTQIIRIREIPFQGTLEDQDAIGQGRMIVGSEDQGSPLVEAIEFLMPGQTKLTAQLGRRPFLHGHRHILEVGQEVLGHFREGFLYQLRECVQGSIRVPGGRIVPLGTTTMPSWTT